MLREFGLYSPASGVPSSPVADEVRVEIVAHTQVHRQVGGDAPVVLRKDAELIHPAGIQAGTESSGHLAGLVGQHGIQAGVEEIGDLRVVARSDGAVIVRAELERVMPDQARVLFSDLPERTAGVVDLAARSAPAEARLEIGKPPAECDGFGRLLGIDQREEAVQPVLQSPVVSEAGFGSPVAAAGQITHGAAVQRVDISARVVDVVARNQAVRLAAVIRDRQTAVRRQDDIALGVEMVVGANLAVGGGVCSHRRAGRGGLIGQRKGL